MRNTVEGNIAIPMTKEKFSDKKETTEEKKKKKRLLKMYFDDANLRTA